jgi:UDP-N-acetylglucosamine:LPS N-acetylglucosamine transferase
MTQLAPPLAAGGLIYQPVRFEDRMHLLLAAADLTVQRAGASTVAELTVAGVPAILIPLPGAPGDHQGANARRLAAAGAAVVVPDHELDTGRLAGEIDRLIGDPDRRRAMGEAARALARPEAAAAVAQLAEEHARA